MRGDVRHRETSVDQKTQQLNSLQATHAQLVTESDRLKDDLQRKELDASQLHARLDKLIELNEAAQASSQQEQASKVERRRQLREISAQAQALEQSGGMSDAEKQKRLADLRDKTRKLLNILLVG
jgi:chromosome segregation ATPase